MAGTFPGGFAFDSKSTITVDITAGLILASNLTITISSDQFTLGNLTDAGPNRFFWANSAAFGALLIQPPNGTFVNFQGGPVGAVTYTPDTGAVASSNVTFTINCHADVPPPPP